MSEQNSFLEFTDDDLKAAMRRTMRTIAILAAILFVIVTMSMGWRSGVLLVVGAAVSISGVY